MLRALVRGPRIEPEGVSSVVARRWRPSAGTITARAGLEGERIYSLRGMGQPERGGAAPVGIKATSPACVRRGRDRRVSGARGAADGAAGAAATAVLPSGGGSGLPAGHKPRCFGECGHPHRAVITCVMCDVSDLCATSHASEENTAQIFKAQLIAGDLL